jgi:hypothetical protein
LPHPAILFAMHVALTDVMTTNAAQVFSNRGRWRRSEPSMRTTESRVSMSAVTSARNDRGAGTRLHMPFDRA